VIIYTWNETCLEDWFEANYRLLGFSKIESLPQKCRKPQYGDYIGWRNGKEYRIELEPTPSSFFLHKPKVRDRIDIIVCWWKSTPKLEWKQKELQKKEIIEVCPLIKVKEHLHLRELFPQFAELRVKELIEQLKQEYENEEFRDQWNTEEDRRELERILKEYE